MKGLKVSFRTLSPQFLFRKLYGLEAFILSDQQPTNPPTHQPTNQPTDRPASQPANLPTNQSLSSHSSDPHRRYEPGEPILQSETLTLKANEYPSPSTTLNSTEIFHNLFIKEHTSIYHRMPNVAYVFCSLIGRSGYYLLKGYRVLTKSARTLPVAEKTYPFRVP